MERVVLSADPGVDDALALALLIDAHRRGRLRVDAVVAVGGNVGLEHTFPNAEWLCRRWRLDADVRAGAPGPDGHSGPPARATHAHGDDGIGGLAPDRPRRPPVDGDRDALAAVLARGPATVVAIGPLTDVARVVSHHPDAAGAIDRLVVMGGAFGAPSGNVTPHAEFNVWADPEAAEVTFAAGLDVTVVPLDVTTRVVLRREHQARLEDAAGGPTLVSRIVGRGIDLAETLGRDGCEMHDPLAAALVVAPDLVTLHPLPVTVVTGGERRGATDRADDSRRAASVALEVDAASATEALVAALSRITEP